MLTRLNKKNLNFNFAEGICIYYSDPLLLLACKLFFLSNMSTLQDKYMLTCKINLLICKIEFNMFTCKIIMLTCNITILTCKKIANMLLISVCMRAVYVDMQLIYVNS